jgi:hypothetical protein
MKEIKLSFNSEVPERLSAYIQSEAYLKEQDLAEHWRRRQSPNMESVRVEGREIVIQLNVLGRTGLSDRNIAQNFGKPYINVSRYEGESKDSGLFLSIHGFKRYVKVKLLRYLGCYMGDAFDTMRHFDSYWPKGKGAISVDDILKEYGGKVDSITTVKGSYIYNEINELIAQKKIVLNRVIEVGPGMGNCLRMIKKYNPEATIIIVDLPTSIPYSFCNLLYRFPDAKFCLPNETAVGMDISEFDFVFLTNEQTDLLSNNSFDLAINTMSFQEMKQSDISEYFRLFRRVLKKDNMFYCLNAVEKHMAYDGTTVPIRFSEYPWKPEDENYKYNLSPVHKGSVTNPFFIKACRLSIDNQS